MVLIQPHFSLRVPPCLVAAGVLLFVLALATSAQATCGDYLEHGLMGEHASQSHQPGQHVPARPCSGPNCHQSPERLPIPVPSQRVVIPTHQEFAYSFSTDELTIAKCQWIAVDDDSLAAASLCSRLFRPPR